MTLNDYLDAARARLNLPSDAKLAVALDVHATTVHGYRRKGDLPDDGTFLRLAVLAGVDESRALLDLNIMRAKTNRVREVYQKILTTITAGFLAFMLWPQPSIASAKVLSPAPQIVYYDVPKWLCQVAPWTSITMPSNPGSMPSGHAAFRVS